MSNDENAMAHPVFRSAERVHIANLLPQADNETSRAYIDAQIALVWPYSSSTRQFAFLLSEPDVRPLKSSRQVKVILYNGAARAVQAAKVGIGDQIKLPLHGCRWQDSEDVTATPGKRIKWDLVYRKAITVEIAPSSSKEVHTVQYESSGTPSPRNSILSNSTVPTTNVHAFPDPPQLPASVETPLSIRTNGFHALGTTPDDPFLDDIEQESGRRRKRTKFARASGAWKLLDDDHEASPVPPTSPLASLRADQNKELQSRAIHDDEAEFENGLPEKVANDVGSAEGDEVSQSPKQKAVPDEDESASLQATHSEERPEPDIEAVQLMRPPEPPPRPAQGMKLQLPPENAFHIDERATTPRLHPLASPSLPLISPLVKRIGIETGYFPSPFEASSELDAISQSGFSEQTEPRNLAVPEHEITIVEESEQVPDNGIPPVLATGAHLPPEAPSVEEENDSLMMEVQEHIAVDEQRGIAESARDIAAEVDEVVISPLRPQSELIAAKELMHGSKSEIAHLRSSDITGGEAQHMAEADVSVLNEMAESNEAEQAPQPKEEATVDEEEPLSTEAGSHEVSQIQLPQSPKAKSPIRAVDGAVDLHAYEVPEHVRLLQGWFERQEARILDSFTPPASSLPEFVTKEKSSALEIPLEQENISTSQSQPSLVNLGIDETAPTSNKHIESTDQEQLPTPAQTQEQPKDVLLDQPEIYNDELLTPEATQEGRGELTIERVISSEKPSAPRAAVNEAMSVEVTSPRSHRGSQRLSRKSETSVVIESPFFSSRKTPKEATNETSPVQETPLLHKSLAKQSKISEVDSGNVAGSASSKGKQVASQIGTTTSLAYYPSFTQLHEYYGQSVDVLAVCAEASTQAIKAKNGPRDWHTTLRLVDPEDASAKVTVQTFRPYKDALPSANLGDVVILRQFKVQTAKHKWQLLSTDASAWAVFRSNPESRAMFDKVDMTGPQLEYGRGETSRVKELARWWSEQGGATSVSAGKDKDSRVDNPSLYATNNERTIEEAEILQSVEQPSSPRRSRRKQPDASAETDNPTDQAKAAAEEASTRKSTTPQPTRHQPPRRARTKTPNPQPIPAAAPSSSPRVATSDNSSLPPPSPTRTRRRTRSTLSPAAASIIGAASASAASAASSVAATSPTEATFAAPRMGTGGGGGSKKSKGKGKASSQAQAKGKDILQIAHSGDGAHDEGKGQDDDAVREYVDRGSVSTRQQQQKRTRRRSSAVSAAGPPLVHELRDGMRYVDEPESEAVHKRVTRSQVHELRDGVRYVDET